MVGRLKGVRRSADEFFVLHVQYNLFDLPNSKVMPHQSEAVFFQRIDNGGCHGRIDYDERYQATSCSL
jgi:hypothetical protein